MNRTVGEAERGHRALDRRDYVRLRRARRGQVDGLLEEWAIERIGFFKHGERLEATGREHAFDSVFLSCDEALDLQIAILLLAHHLDLGPREQRFDAAEGGDESGGIVGANHATAG